MMFELTDELLVIFERIVGGKVYSVNYDLKYRLYNVTFKRDGCSEKEEKKVSRELIEDVMAGRTNLDGLRKE